MSNHGMSALHFAMAFTEKKGVKRTLDVKGLETKYEAV